jgi:hypothetical protein
MRNVPRDTHHMVSEVGPDVSETRKSDRVVASFCAIVVVVACSRPPTSDEPMEGSGSGGESSGGIGPMPGDLDEHCAGTLDPRRAYVVAEGNLDEGALLLIAVDDPQERCIAAWQRGGVQRQDPYAFLVRPTDGALLAGYVTHDGIVFDALGLDWMSSGRDMGNDTVLASFEYGYGPLVVWAFEGDTIYYSLAGFGDYPDIDELIDGQGNEVEPAFVGSLLTITEDGARWGFVRRTGSANAALARTSASGEVSMFEAPPNFAAEPWIARGARVAGDGGWVVVARTVDASTSTPSKVLERWTFGPEGLTIDGEFPAEGLDVVATDSSDAAPNFFALDGEGALVEVVPNDLAGSSQKWMAVVRAPLDGAFETIVSLDDELDADGDFEVTNIFGVVTGP